MKNLPALTMILAAAVLIGCGDPRQIAEEGVRTVGAGKLREDAARVYKEIFTGRSPVFQEVNKSAWPESFRKLSPRHVGAYPDGLSIALKKDGNTEHGLYVIPQSMEHTPAPTNRATFQQ